MDDNRPTQVSVSTAQSANAADRPHSADFLMEESRDHWWNRDFLELMGRRLRLDLCRRVLDLGCGRGHWSRSLCVALPADAEVVGIDKEATWIAEAEAYRRQAGLSDRFRYRQGFVDSLSFDDSSFDLVTCQTLLIHVPDPERVLREMLRVLQPGGLLLVAEPSNLCQCLRWSNLTRQDFLNRDGVERLLRVVKFHVLCEKGKYASGEGFNSIGDLVPGYFKELGLHDISVFQSDKAAALLPPYETSEQRAEIADTLSGIESGRYGWREEEARRYFLAGGGTDAEFSDFWSWAMRDNARLQEALNQGQYHAARGFSLYLISGRKGAG
jgi:ubiquinone/menaquinone biosynthesis C-methylase UbiE